MDMMAVPGPVVVLGRRWRIRQYLNQLPVAATLSSVKWAWVIFAIFNGISRVNAVGSAHADRMAVAYGEIKILETSI